MLARVSLLSASLKPYLLHPMSLTVFFDIGDVLVDVKSMIRLACYNAANACYSISGDFSESDLVEAYIELDRGIHYTHMNHLFGDRMVAEAAIRQVTGKHDPKMVAIFLTAYRSIVRQEIRPTCELTSFFGSFGKESALKIDFGVISDGTTDEQLETLVRLNVIHHFQPQLLLISQSFGEEKTSTAIFREAIARCNAPPHQIVMIGDNLERDMKNSALVGMIPGYFDRFAIGNVTPVSQPAFSYRANDFEQLATVITKIYYHQ